MNHAMQIIQSPESRSIIKVSVETLLRHRAVASHWQWPHPNRRQPMQDRRWDRRPTYKLSPEAGVNHEATFFPPRCKGRKSLRISDFDAGCWLAEHGMSILRSRHGHFMKTSTIYIYMCVFFFFHFLVLITSTIANPTIASAMPIWIARRRPTFPPTNKMCLRSHIQ